MTSLSLGRCCQTSWEQIRARVNKAVVFVDSASSECLHWTGGGLTLVNAGATNIKEFSSFENGGPEERKAVFILSTLLTGTTTDILRDIIKASNFQYVIIVSTLSPGMHTLVHFGVVDDELRAFHQLEDDVLDWMGNMNYISEVMYVPVAVAAVTPLLFVMPQHSQMFPLLPTDIQHLQKVHQKDGSEGFDLDFTHLGREAQLQMKLLVCSLNSLFELLSVSEDCYALGATSKVVATELASLSWAKARRKSAKNKASLLLIDRSLDVASAVSHQSETLLDRILALLPRLPGHNNDVQVNMAPLCSVPSDCDESIIVPGCLAHSVDGPTTQLLNKLCTSKSKESLMEINRQLVEAASASNLPLKLSAKPGRVTPEQLMSTAALFKGCTSVVRRHAGLLQLVMATIQALNHPRNSKLDSLLGIEKGLISCFGEDDGSVMLGQLIQTINRDLERPVGERLHSLEDMFLFLIFIYSVFDSESLQQEKILQASLVGATLDEEAENLPSFLQEMLGPKFREDKVRQVLEEVFTRLKGLASARDHLKQFRSVAESGGMTSPSSLKPLLKQVMEAIFSPDKPDLSDIVYKSTGLRDFIKSGFGLFMNVSKPRPTDHPLLIVFVIGGVTATELKQVKETLAASTSKVQVIVGSTCLLRPHDMLRCVLAQDNLRPTSNSL